MTDEKRKTTDVDTNGDANERAWGLISNAYGGDWDLANPEWKAAALKWRDAYQPTYGDDDTAESADLHGFADQLDRMAEDLKSIAEEARKPIVVDLP